MKWVGMPRSFRLGEDEFGNAVVQHALAVDHGLLLGVEGGGVVLEVDDDGAGLGAFIEDLGLALVDPGAPAVHLEYPHPIPQSTSSPSTGEDTHTIDVTKMRQAVNL